MWPWKHKPSNLELLERLESVERRFKTLTEDVNDFFDSVRRAENRLVKKRSKMDDVTVTQEGLESATVAGNGHSSSPHRALNPHQLEVQAAILKRRGGIQ